MTPDDPINDAILSNATGPAQASGDEGSITQHNLADQIAAAKYLAGLAAMKKPGRGLRFSRLSPPGAV